MKPLALDTETDLIELYCKAPPLVCVSWARRDDAGKFAGDLFTWNDPHALETIRRWLETEPLIVGQNICFDMAVLAAQWPELLPAIFRAYDENRITDTGLREKLIDIATIGRTFLGSYDLKAMALKHLGVTLDKETHRGGYGPLRHVPLDLWPEGAVKYPVDDAVSTLGVWEAQEKHAHYLKDQYRQAKYAFWLHLMSCWGVMTDQEAVARLEASLRQQHAALQVDLIREGLLRLKTKKGTDYARDTKAAKARMIAALGDQAKLTDKGGICLDGDACKDSGDPVLQKYADYSAIANKLNKDIPALRQPRIHTKIDSLLVTGRISASGSEENGGYNTTNSPRTGGVRECFVPRPGWLFVDSDFDGLELRCMSQACLELVGESAMADVLNRGGDDGDVHLALGAKLIGIDFEEAKRRKKQKDVKEARQTAKPANFGLAGGMGVARFIQAAKEQYGIILTEEQARLLIRTWRETWPEFRHYFNLAQAATAKGYAQVEQLFSGRFRGGLSYTEWCNTWFQGLGADVAKSAGWAITRACYDSSQGSILLGCRVVIFAHDQFIVEVPDDALRHARAKEVGRLMVEAARPWLPDVPATTTPCLATCFSKGAEAVYDENGELLPWSPKKEEAKAA